MKMYVFLGIMAMLFSTTLCADAQQDYLARFQTFQAYSQNLPTTPDDAFISFINQDKPLSIKLREKWLYQLAKKQNWAEFSQYYKPSNDLSLSCYSEIAAFNQGLQQQALNAAKSLWLNPKSMPEPCNDLFSILKKQGALTDGLIIQRIALALKERNLSLARYLTKQFPIARPAEEQLLMRVNQNPNYIAQLTPGPLHQSLYLFGLKRLVSINMDTALKLYQKALQRGFLDEAHQQAFLAHVALYKAMRGQEDAPVWFNKVKPAYYNDVLIDWQIRFALKKRLWKQVERLTSLPQYKEDPCWQYWQARALEAQGQSEKAKAIYQQLAQKRQYYGFMASLRLNKKPSFENETVTTNLSLLKPYQVILDKVKSDYQSKQDGQASHLLNDFISELPKNEQSALAFWVASTLDWHVKSIYLSNNDILNNQLSLRFPLTHQSDIDNFAKAYHIPKEYIYAIIRQESSFKQDVISFAGAYGLMQIMPRTASLITRHSHISYRDKKELFQPAKNIQIGVAYLNVLAKQFKRHPILIAAAYNAGPHMASYWLRNHSITDVDIWIETIPWQETRNYLKNVMAFYTVYQFRLNNHADVKANLQKL